jgi:hypothetical protein
MFCVSLFVLLSFYLGHSVGCPSPLRILITPLVSSTLFTIFKNKIAGSQVYANNKNNHEYIHSNYEIQSLEGIS